MLPAGQSSTPFQTRLRFYDLDVRLTCDDSAYLEMFLHTYHRFRAGESVASPAQTVEIAIYTTPRNAWGRPMLVVDDQAWPLADPHRLQAYVYELILFELAAHVRSHILIHAGALVCNGRALILAGDSQHGKTTLVLALLRRRFRFLSDELAALGRGDGLVHPFARRLRIRRGALELAGYRVPAAAPRWLDKLVLDVEEIEPDALAAPAPLADVIVLHDPAARAQPSLSPHQLAVMLDRVDADLLAAVHLFGGDSAVGVDQAGEYPVLHITAAQPSTVLDELERLCRRHGILILDVRKRAESCPRFTGPARLEPISASAAVMHLLAGFHGTHRSALLQHECRGQATRLYLELAHLVTPARCHRLHTGPLEEMADQVSALVATPPCA